MYRVFSTIAALSLVMWVGCADEEEINSAGLPVCVEDDLDAQPFFGPGFDAEQGVVLGTAQDSYVASTTWVFIKPDQQERFFQVAGAVIESASQLDGLVGMSLAGSDKCGSARTLTVWRSEQAMMDFVVSDAHAAAMAQGPDLVLNGVVTHWNVGSDNVPPSWDEAQAEADLAAPVY